MVNDTIIGCIGYIGFVNSLSNGKRDEYIGIDIKHESIHGTGVHGIPTNGSYNGYVYFECQNGRFVKRMNITKKFSPSELFSHIENKQALIDGDDVKIEVM